MRGIAARQLFLLSEAILRATSLGHIVTPASLSANIAKTADVAILSVTSAFVLTS